MDAAKPLNYAPKEPASGRTKRWIFRALGILLLVFIAVAWISNGIGALRNIYYEHRCLVFVEPPDHVVWEMNRGAIVHQEMDATLNNFSIGLVKKLYGPPVFLHELKRPDGSRRLGSIEFEPWPRSGSNGQFTLLYESWDVSVIPKAETWSFTVITANGGTPMSHWKFFAGQPDPQNPSHFTFDYELDGTRHTCDAWLGDDDKLLISQRP